MTGEIDMLDFYLASVKRIRNTDLDIKWKWKKLAEEAWVIRHWRRMRKGKKLPSVKKETQAPPEEVEVLVPTFGWNHLVKCERIPEEARKMLQQGEELKKGRGSRYRVRGAWATFESMLRPVEIEIGLSSRETYVKRALQQTKQRIREALWPKE
jgi:hypothetical protein